MASVTILSDNGATSGSAGLKTSGGNDGVLLLQTTTSGGTPTTAISISNTQVVTFTNQPTYTGGTANGVLYLNGSKAVTSGTALVFDGTNLGLGVTPSAWSTYKALQIAGAGFMGTSSDLNASANAYYNAGWKYYGTGLATLYNQSAGVHSWYNAASGTAGNAISLTQAMTLDASGNLMVGQTSATGKLSITGTGSSNTGILAINATDTSTTFVWASQAYISGMTSGQNFIHMLGSAGSTKNAAWFGYKYSSAGSNSNLLTMGLYGVDNVLNVNGNANVSLYGATTTANGVGITFPAAQSASSDANCLDDYEEGTWTPSLRDGGNNRNPTYQYGPSGTYVKVGKLVFIRWGFKLSSKGAGSGSGEIQIYGLPFVPAATGGYQEENVSVSAGILNTASNSPAARMVVSTSSYLFGRIANNADTVWTYNDLTDTSWIIGELTYIATA